MLVAAACHVHSSWSYDGSWSLEHLAREFGRRGYRVVMMTEHDRGFSESRRLAHRAACAEASNEEVLVISGVEYSDASNTVHILTWGPVPFLGEGRDTGELLSQVQSSGGVAVLAHPSRRNAWKLFRSDWSSHLTGIEVWNRKTDGWAPSRHAQPLLELSKAAPFAGIDFHDRWQFFPLAMTLELESDISEEAVLACLKQRRMRATAFHRRIDSGVITRGRAVLNTVELGRRAAAWGLRQARRRVSATSARG